MALGVWVGMMATLGIGRFACCVTWRTIRYSPGASASVTSLARYDHKTMRSDAKYAIAFIAPARRRNVRSEEHTSELQSRENLVCRLLLEKKNQQFLIDVVWCLVIL